jgi:hypothetical protein
MRKFTGVHPQDIVVLLKVVANWPQQRWQGKDLAQTLELSTSEISDSMARPTRLTVTSVIKVIIITRVR